MSEAQPSNWSTTDVVHFASLSRSRPTQLSSSTIIEICQWIIIGVLCQVIDLFGICTNTINIICFVKQRFKDPVNVSLLGLSLSDLGCVTTLVWTNICLTPAFSNADLPFDPAEIQYLTSALPHATFTRITAWITAFITLERCLCITVPLKVKQVVTAKRVFIIILCTFIILISSSAPVFVVNRIGLKFFTNKNKSLIGLVYMHDREIVERISFAINNTGVPFCSFVVTIVCTVTLVIKLNTKAKWRQESTSTQQGDNISSRNKKVAKMVVLISTLFIACFAPISVMFIAMILEPEFSIGGKYSGPFILIGGFGIVLESLNASINIFIYYRMSSKYRQTLHELFFRRPATEVSAWRGPCKLCISFKS